MNLAKLIRGEAMSTVKALVIVQTIVAVAACSKPATPPSKPVEASQSAAASPKAIDVTLNEYSINLSSQTLPAGPVTFSVKNAGTTAHEFVVIKTDTRAADFPITTFEGERDRIDEDAAGKNVGETGDMEPGTSKTLTITLEPGHYVAVCNLPGHYSKGMHQDLTVNP